MKKRLTISIIFLVLCALVIAYIPSKKAHPAEQASVIQTTTHSTKTIDETEEYPDLKEKIDQIINGEKSLDGASIGISIRSSDSGDVIYDHHGKKRMNPASNMKLMTAAAAMSVLGEDYTFFTELATNGDIEEGTLEGDLYMKGKGDPTLLPDDLSDFAEKLDDKGIEKISGDVIADDTWYDDERLSPGLAASDEQYYYGAPISALNVAPDDDYNTGSVVVEVSPETKAGQEPDVDVSPENKYVKVDNQAQTTGANGENDIEIKREHGTNKLTIGGTIPVGAGDTKEWMAVWDPSAYTLDLFKKALEENDIEIKGKTKQKKTPEDAEILISHESMPLEDMLVPFMKLSNNAHAEVLVKEMGREIHNEGSWEKGLKVMKQVLPNFSVDVDELAIHDGSGLSHEDLLPARDVSELLYDVNTQDWYDSFVASLPVAGDDDKMVGGTLMDRLEDIDVKAKTGSIDGVSSLSGYLETESGDKLTFSILINHLLDEADGPQIEDKIINEIADDES